MSHHCILCNKYYSSYKSLWNHKKKFHNDNVFQCTPNVLQSIPNVIHQSTPNIGNEYACKYCSNFYSSRQNKWKHEQKCKIKKEEENNKEKNRQKELEIRVDFTQLGI